MLDLIEGLIIKKPHENAPDFVKGKVSINVEKFIEYLRNNSNNGWVNFDLKESKEGKLYCQLDTYRRDLPPR